MFLMSQITMFNVKGVALSDESKENYHLTSPQRSVLACQLIVLVFMAHNFCCFNSLSPLLASFPAMACICFK